MKTILKDLAKSFILTQPSVFCFHVVIVILKKHLNDNRRVISTFSIRIVLHFILLKNQTMDSDTTREL